MFFISLLFFMHDILFYELVIWEHDFKNKKKNKTIFEQKKKEEKNISKWGACVRKLF
jgi:hypothetical protein